MTDAGTPAISDPGEDLVRLCGENGVTVQAIPGCCAAVCALAVSGLPTGRFTFEGFLSANKKERREALTRLAGVENIVFCCNRSTADHIISSPLFLDPTYKRIHPDYTNYTQRFENKEIVSEAVERVKKRMSRNENNMIE